MQQRKKPKLFLTPRIQVMEKQLLNLLEPDNPCSWSKTYSGGENHPKELQETELATQKLCSLKTQGCTLHSVLFEKACSAFSPCLHTVPAFRDFVNKLGASPAGLALRVNAAVHSEWSIRSIHSSSCNQVFTQIRHAMQIQVSKQLFNFFASHLFLCQSCKKQTRDLQETPRGKRESPRPESVQQRNHKFICIQKTLDPIHW